MNSKTKYIGISNRIPLKVIERALYCYIQTGHVDKDMYLNHIQEYTKGANRANKTALHLSVLLTRNETIISKMKPKLLNSDLFTLSEGERRSLVLCLFCLTYPIAYDILTAFATGFKVQPHLSKQFLLQKIGAIYGGNRAMHIAVDEVISLLIECNFIRREKVGIFSFGSKLSTNSNFITELAVYTDIKLSSSKSIMVDDLNYKPWFSFFEFTNTTPNQFNTLISFKDGIIGGGYLTI